MSGIIHVGPLTGPAMAPDEPSGTRPAGPVVLRIKLRYDDVEAMVQKFAPNVGKSGLFLPTRSVQTVGAEIKFELRLANEQTALVGLGRVKAVKAPDPGDPKATFGMAIELMRVTRESRDLILRMLERRRQLGLVEVAIPMPADIDAARRADVVDTSIKDAPSTAVPAPIHDSKRDDGLLTAARRPTGPIAVARPPSFAPLAPEPSRRKRPAINEVIATASGPVGSVVTVPGLDDEVDVAAVLVRARLLAGGDLDAELDALFDAAAAPIEIGIEAASAELAKQLGGAAIRRDARWAPPPAVSEPPVVDARATGSEPPVVDAADVVAHLPDVAAVDARAEGGTPAVSESPVVAPVEIVAPQPAAMIVDPATATAALEPAAAKGRRLPVADEDAAREQARDDAFHRRRVDDDAEDAERDRDSFREVDEGLRTPGAANEVITEPGASVDKILIRDEPDPALAPVEHEVDPEQIHDEIHQLSEDDFEEVEHTQIGAEPDPRAFDEHSFATRPSGEDAALAERLDAHLAEFEAEAEHDDLGIAEASGLYERSKLDQGHVATPEATRRAEPEYIQRYEAPEGGTLDEHLDAKAPEAVDAYGRTLDSDAGELATTGGESTPDAQADAFTLDVDGIEEVDDFEILAEADADDADLLSAHGEADASGSRELEPARPSHSDFASRLDLGEESDPYEAAPDEGFYQRRDEFQQSLGELDPRVASAGHALAAFEEHDEGGDFGAPATFTPTPPGEPIRPIFDEQGDSSFTLAGDVSVGDSLEFDAPHAGFVAPNQFDQSDVIDIGPEKVRARNNPVDPRIVPPAPRGLPTSAPIYNEPYVLRGPPPALGGIDDEVDLESALEALDVDLDDLSIPHASTELPARGTPTIRPSAQSPRPKPQTPAHQSGSGRVVTPPAAQASRMQHPSNLPVRATTDDGVLIDFDEDDDFER